MALADRVAVMRDGRIEQIGTPREIYLRPRSRFVADFIGESNFFPAGAGRRGVVMVRPESIVLSPGDDGTGFVRGRVLHRSFLGNCTRVAVACDECEGPVLAELHGRDADELEQLAPGQPVWLSWEREAAVPIDDSEEEPLR